MRGRIGTAFVLGAGLGTRLRPLTLVRPKPLLPIFGKPLITFALDHLSALGVESFVINTHHLAGQFEALFSGGAYSDRSVKLVHEPRLLETGGGIKNAEQWIGEEPFIVYSGDILTDIDLEGLVDEHFRKGNDVTLALRNTGLASSLALSADGRVTDLKAAGDCGGTYDFANVSIWNPGIFRRIPAGEKISFVPILADWLEKDGRIGGVVLNERNWFNIGSRTEYLAVHRKVAELSWRPPYIHPSHWPAEIAVDSKVADTARLLGFYAVGSGAIVECSASIEDSVVWENATIASGAILRNCVVAEGIAVSGHHEDVDLTQTSPIGGGTQSQE